MKIIKNRQSALLKHTMKRWCFHSLMLLVVFLSGCTGVLKTSEPVDASKQKSVPGQTPQAKTEDMPGEKPAPYKMHSNKLKVKKERAIKENVKKQISLAEQSLAEKKYDQAIDIIKKIQTLDPENDKARFLENEARYLAGKALYSEHQYIASLSMLTKINKDYKDVKKITADIKTKMKKEAEIHYKKGVRYFINEELKKAIAEWEKTLLLNPGHPKAAKDIENAKHLLVELEKIK